MNYSREAVAARAADALTGAPTRPRVLVGFDGFVDSIVHMVDRRTDMSPTGYVPIRTIAQFAARCAAAAGRSTNIERVNLEDRFGGNGPLMAGALARLGADTTFIGAVEGSPGEVHPLFRELQRRGVNVHPIAPPSHTLCMEFDDGKLMLNETSNVQAVTWERIVSRVGLGVVRGLVESSRLIGIVNWSLLGGVQGIWEGLRRDMLPGLAPAPRTLFVDLSDPAKRTDADLAGAMRELGALARAGLDVVLGLNLAEAQRLAGRPAQGEPSGPPVVDLARQLYSTLAIGAVVVHTRRGAAGADASAATWFEGPFTNSPRLSTGAGDHFNAGFALARVTGLPMDACLASGCAVSGLYVRTGLSPALADLAAFLRALPAPD